jgi:uncharacterized membrane protein
MNKEREARVWPGWPVLALTIALYVFGVVMLVLGATWEVWTGLGALALAVLSSLGFFTLQPNEARVLVLFGRRARRGTQGGHGEQPDGRAVRRVAGQLHRQHWDALPVRVG